MDDETTNDLQESFEALADEAIDHWWRTYRHKRGHSASEVTRYNKRRTLTILNRTARRLFPEDSCALTKVLEDRRDFLDWKGSLEGGVSSGTLRNYIITLRDYEAYLVAAGLLDRPLITQDDIPANNTPPPIVIYTEQELSRMIAASWMGGYRWAAFIHFLAATGRRVGEALRLEFSTLREDRGGFYFELDRTKNGDQCYVPVPSDFADTFLRGEGWQELLHEFDVAPTRVSRDPNQFVFPWSYGAVYDRFGRLCKATKVENRGFHNFRHTVITNRIASGMPLQAVASLAGHRNPSLTATRYNHATALNYRHYLDEP